MYVLITCKFKKDQMNSNQETTLMHVPYDNAYFEGMVNQIYPSELQLNKANTSDTEAPFWIYICLFQTALFHPKFMINVMTLF